MTMQQQAAQGQQGQQQVPLIPFRRATVAKQSFLSDYVYTSGKRESQQQVSAGYLARLLLPGKFSVAETTASGLSEDAPYNLIQELRLKDSGGGTVFQLTGYEAEQWSRMLGAHRAWYNQSADTSVFSGTMGNGDTPTLAWEIAIETNDRDNLGLLPNQSDAYKYTMEIDWASPAELWGTPGDGAVTGQVSPIYRFYEIPTPTALNGMPQQTAPDLYGVWHQVVDDQFNPGTFGGSGVLNNQRYNIPVGVIYRGLILLTRHNNGDLAFPARGNHIDSLQLFYGSNTLKWEVSGEALRQQQFERTGKDADTGVYLLDFVSDSGLWPGDDFRRDLLDTRELAQCWLSINFSGTSGDSLQVGIVRDALIAPRGIMI